jgi:DNA uptake protein ComE-like DNA-binding protein
LIVPRPRQAPGQPPFLTPPPPAPWRGRATQILLALLPVISAGLLSFVPFLYMAMTRHRRRDWQVFAAYVLAIAFIIAMISASEPGVSTTMAGGLLTLLIGVSATHSFIALQPPRPGGREGKRGQAAAVLAARARIRQRDLARKLASEDPGLARELKIGRPDLTRTYDDGGLVDVNWVPGDVLARCLNLSPAEADAVVAARAQLGRFTSLAELTTYASLRPERLDNLSDLIIFG